MSAQQQPPEPGGDGAGIAPLREVEREFGVTLDYRGADGWTTVADVYAALLDRLPAEEGGQPEVWQRFSAAMCRETGMSPGRISPESGLAAEDGMWVHVVKPSPALWVVLALAGIAGLVWVLRSV